MTGAAPNGIAMSSPPSCESGGCGASASNVTLVQIGGGSPPPPAPEYHPPPPLPPRSSRDELAKRAIDISIGLPLALSALPLSAAIALAIKLDSRGPILVTRQCRGRGYRPFRVFKFRTLRHGAENSYDGYQIQDDDERMTRVGRLLRRYNLDEIPQLLNVLEGSMSLVGARPLDDWESARCLLDHEHRFAMKPGLTGLAQVMGRSLDFFDRADLDVQYVRAWSLREDLRILLKTVMPRASHAIS